MSIKKTENIRLKRFHAVEPLYIISQIHTITNPPSHFSCVILYFVLITFYTSHKFVLLLYSQV